MLIYRKIIQYFQSPYKNTFQKTKPLTSVQLASKRYQWKISFCSLIVRPLACRYNSRHKLYYFSYVCAGCYTYPPTHFKMKKNGTNRKVKNKAVGVDLQRPYDILLRYKALQSIQDAHKEGIEKGRTSKTPERPFLSGFLNEVRTNFEQKFCMRAENTQIKKWFLVWLKGEFSF